MADSKLTALSENTAPALADWMYLVDDDGGSPASYVSQKVTLSKIKALISGLLAYIAYNPGTVVDATTTSTSFADIDATNLTVTFIAPSSGSVLVRLTALCVIANAASTYLWNLRTTGGSDITGSYHSVTSNSNQVTVSVVVAITGLTPGASTTYRWGHAVTGSTGHIRYGDDASTRYGPAVMEVFSA